MQLDYTGLTHSLPAPWLRASKVKLPAPIIHPAVEFILSHQKGSKYMYSVILNDELTHHKHKWEGTWSDRYGDICWRDVYQNIFEATVSSSYRALHYKIITRIHVTNELLFRMGIADSSRCARCSGSVRDTLEHKFWLCPTVHEFWENIKAWLLGNNVVTNWDQFTESGVLLGITNDSLMNHIIVCAKEIIRRGMGLSLQHLLECLKKDRETEYYIAKMNDTVDRHQRKWDLIPVDLM